MREWCGINDILCGAGWKILTKVNLTGSTLFLRLFCSGLKKGFEMQGMSWEIEKRELPAFTLRVFFVAF